MSFSFLNSLLQFFNGQRTPWPVSDWVPLMGLGEILDAELPLLLDILGKGLMGIWLKELFKITFDGISIFNFSEPPPDNFKGFFGQIGGSRGRDSAFFVTPGGWSRSF